ncbi:MAG: hypothetical protein JRN52_15085 [Nitrososphaerota archaeon]|nr:hypothetical protein [Nitrososphaerota archaeon]
MRLDESKKLQHSAECDIELHEALATLWIILKKSDLGDSNDRKKYEDATNALMTKLGKLSRNFEANTSVSASD